MLKIKNWKVILDGRDITNMPMINYIGFSKEWSCLCKPSPLENRAEWTAIVTERDDDRLYYRAVYKWEDIAYCSSREEAERALMEAEQREYDMCEACASDEFDF